MRRILDALRTLLGRSEPMQEISRIRAQWGELNVEIAGVLEKLNTMAARFAKRESRAAQKELTPPEAPQLEPSAAPAGSPKTRLYQRLREKRASQTRRAVSE